MKHKLLDTPKFKIEILSSGEKKEFRSMIHREEKKLAIALEQLTKDSRDEDRTVLESIIDVIKSCCTEELDIEKLAFFDIENIFLKLRASSIGETQIAERECEKCSSVNKIIIDFNKTELSGKLVTDIQLRDNFFIRMKLPTMYYLWDTLAKMDKEIGYDEIEKIISESIEYFYDQNEVYNYSPEEIIDFINDNFTKNDFDKVMKYFQDIPRLKMKVDEKCDSCGHEKEFELSSIYDFL